MRKKIHSDVMLIGLVIAIPRVAVGLLDVVGGDFASGITARIVKVGSTIGPVQSSPIRSFL